MRRSRPYEPRRSSAADGPSGLTEVFCNNCGARLAATAILCPECGSPTDPLAKDDLTLPVSGAQGAVGELTADQMAELVDTNRSRVGILVVTRGPERRYWRLNPRADYGAFNRVATNRIRCQLIEDNWADICRVAGTLHTRAAPPRT